MKSLLEDRRIRFIVNFVTIALIFLLVYIFVKYLLPILLPFIIGWLIAMLVDPAVRFLNRKLLIPRRLASLICVLLVVSVIGFLLYLLFSRMISEFTALLENLPTYLQSFPSSLDEILQRVADTLSVFVTISPDTLMDMVDNFFASFPGRLSSWILSIIPPVAVRVPIMFLYIVIIIISAYFISCDYRKIRKFLMYQVPAKYKSFFIEGKGFMKGSLAKLIRAYGIIMLIGFLECLAAFSIIRLPYAIAVSALVAIVDILPVLGSGTVLIPWALYNLIVGNYFMAVYLICLYVIYVIVRQSIEPKIVGDSLGINPLVMLMAIFFGFKLLGGWGVIVFPIALIVIKHLNDTGKIKLWRMPPS